MNNLKDVKLFHILSLVVFIWMCGNFFAGLFGWFLFVQFVMPDDWVF